jgi:uncharacterized Fe-S cluster-containing radical SAM superfamily enzyme
MLTKNIIRAMNDYGIKRYIVTTGLSVDTHLIKRMNGKNGYRMDVSKLP